MKKIVLTFGLVSGGILALMFGISMPLIMNGTIAHKYGMLVGYTSMILSFLAVFFGIRAYREKSGGSISFGRAFQVGILIALIGCAVYVVGWEIIYWGFIPDFEVKYAALILDQMRAEGKPAHEIAQAEVEMERFKKLYKNPVYNVGMTIMEVFPVGLIMTLVSAAILRRKETGGGGALATA